MSQLVGHTLGQYHIIEQIGQGGMATVYKAYQSRLRRYVAIKVLSPTLVNQPGFDTRFRREADAAASLNHPNILPVFDSGEQDGYAYIVMRYVEGGRTLKDVMATWPDMAQATSLIEQIAAALDFAHQQGVIHRDVKPGNVLMDGDWALLTDFGLAKMLESALTLPDLDPNEAENVCLVTLTGSAILGTPAYISPEQAQGLEVDRRTDIYSLGIILFEMLTGQIPHCADTPLATVLRRITEPQPRARDINPDIPEAVERVLRRALACAPADRYARATEMSQDLRRAVSEPLPRQGIHPDIAGATESTIPQTSGRDADDRPAGVAETPVLPGPTEGESHLQPSMASPPAASLSAVELEEQLYKLYIDGLNAFWLEEWDHALHCFQAILDLQPGYLDVAEKLQQARLPMLYARAQAAMEAQTWQEAVATLEELTAGPSRYRDAETLLEEARKQSQLSDLYAQASLLYRARQWQAVVNVFGQIHDIDPGYLDPENLLPLAEREIAQLERQQELDDAYGRALEEMSAGHWEAARQVLAQIQEIEPEYREVDRLLAKVDAEIRREEAERQQKEQIALLYRQAQELARAAQWQQASSRMDQIYALDAQFPDPEGVATGAREGMERQARLNALYARAQAAREAEDWEGAISALEELVLEAEDYRDAAALLQAAKKRRQLADLYAQARQFHQSGQWQDVLDTLAQMHDIEPRYADPDRLLRAAKQAIKAIDRETTPTHAWARPAIVQSLISALARRAFPWKWALGIGGLVVVLGLATAGLIAASRSRERSTPTLTAAALVPAATGTATSAPDTPTPASTSTPGPVPTDTPKPPTPTATHTATPAPTSTPAPTATGTATFTATPHPPTATPTVTSTPAATRTPTPTLPPTATLTPTPTPPPQWGAGDSRVRAKDGAVMVYVPAGEFWMGSTDADIDAVIAGCSDCVRESFGHEQPQHKVSVNAFWIDRTEVTNAQYRRCVADGACSPPSSAESNTRPSYYGNPEFDNYPVVNVTWYQAQAYARWAGGRLPTEAEWEYAARGPNRNTYPWGNSAPNRSLLNYNWNMNDTTAVGSYPDGASWCGALDMAGNVWEWVSSSYRDYPYNPGDGRENPDASGKGVHRGGAFPYPMAQVRSAHRSVDRPDGPWATLGIRVVVSPTSLP